MNKLGMSITNSHRENYSIDDQIKLFARVGFDTFFLSSGVTEDLDKIPRWAELARGCGIGFEAVHAPAGGVNRLWLADDSCHAYIEK